MKSQKKTVNYLTLKNQEQDTKAHVHVVLLVKYKPLSQS